MPNWCENALHIFGASEDIKHFMEANIPVDVTTVRQVNKLPGGKVDMVIYHSYHTVVVNPYPDIVVDRLNAEKQSG